jgi:type I restriction enzyme S subunit
LAEGDVIVAMDRPVVTAGFKCASVMAADTPSLLVQRVARIRASDALLRRWISVAARSDGFIRHVLAGQTGTQLPHIRSREILNFPLPVPARTQMEAVVDRAEELLTVADECDRDAAVSLRRVTMLRQSLLGIAFDGRLVPQDPRDEPASDLLDRIRHECAAGTAGPKKKPARSRR